MVNYSIEGGSRVRTTTGRPSRIILITLTDRLPVLALGVTVKREYLKSLPNV